MPDRAGKRRAIRHQRLHDRQGQLPQFAQARALLVVLVQGLIGAQCFLDLGVVGQVVGLAESQVASGLALGGAKVGQAVFGHQARRLRGDGAACMRGGSGMLGHAAIVPGRDLSLG